VTFQDIFKKTFLENVQSLSLPEALLTLVSALLLGTFIFFIYRVCFSGVIYSKNFNITLIAVTVITSVIVITLATNIVLSLGMVGALSIVRYRTAIKEPLDVAYIFWAITTGIVCGAGLYLFAAITAITIGLIFLLARFIKDQDSKFVVVINLNRAAWREVNDALTGTRHTLRSRTVSKDEMEVIIELNARSDKTAFVNRISEIEQVKSVSLVNYRTGL
jgi:uncharacterized membrane protein YhiD involved in acid resistance